ncbi:MAG: SRPBCC family protein [Solirubrobacteraceae bacterium]
MSNGAPPSYTYTHTVEADVEAEAVWGLYADVSTWPNWDAQAELVTRGGPFTAGTIGTMKFRGQQPLDYRLIKVVPGREFVDETPLGELVVRVSHLLEPLGPGRLRITYTAEIDGPADEAVQLGPVITADFPDTIARLVSIAARDRSPAAGGQAPGSVS